MDVPKLHNKYHRTAGPDAVYVGRGSPWGNPFVIGRDGDRDEVCDLHERWLLADPVRVDSVRRELVGRDLVCFCHPARCHGDVLLRVANAPVCEGCGTPVDETTGTCGWCRPSLE